MDDNAKDDIGNVADIRMDNVFVETSIKEQLMSQVIQPLKAFDKMPETFLGVLLYGKPGTGKTYLAKAIAGELNAPLYTFDSPDVASIMKVFDSIRTHELAVLLFDDIFCFPGKLLALCRNMKNTHLLLIATSCYPDRINDNLFSHFFNVQIRVDLPDFSLRQRFIESCFANVLVPFESGFFARMAALTELYSLRDLCYLTYNVRREAYIAKVEKFSLDLISLSMKNFEISSYTDSAESIRRWDAKRN